LIWWRAREGDPPKPRGCLSSSGESAVECVILRSTIFSQSFWSWMLSALSGVGHWIGQWEARSPLRFHVLHRTAEPHHSHDEPEIHSPDQCFQQKAVPPESRYQPAFCLLQPCRVHSSLRVTPAMQAGISDHIWTMNELLGNA